MTEAQVAVTPTVDALIGAYIKLRNIHDARETEHKAKQKTIKDKLAKLEAALQMKMHLDGVKAFNTDAGTAYKTTVDRATVADMDALIDYIKERDAWDLLEKRVSKTAVRALLDEDQPIPPGVNWNSATVIHVRKPNER